MSIIENILQPLSGNLFSIMRDTKNAWYYIEVGIPKGWVYKGNDIIECEVVKEWEKPTPGILVKISPKIEDITVDDLIHFAELILETNAKIVEKEQEFVDKVNKVKKALREEKTGFDKELDELKDRSFDVFNIKKEDITSEVKRGRGRPRGSKNKTKSTDE